MLTLLRAYGPEFQLILMSKPLSARARSAIKEAIRLDAIEAPRREAEQRKKDASDASSAREKTGATNKAAVRPGRNRVRGLSTLRLPTHDPSLFTTAGDDISSLFTTAGDDISNARR